jgi:hypothetical protein
MVKRDTFSLLWGSKSVIESSPERGLRSDLEMRCG